ncbi:MAG TPA: hypothetical protein VJR27_05365 [Candidatus Saccharimonadales bacterium]|nr:hypothetical protein [Candidatus Saccharimonadales bacterium]
MDKRHLHHLWTRIRRVKIWQLFVLFVVSMGVCVFSLRANNLQMVHLRNDVYQADKTGTGVETALQKLRSYVQVHMNTNLTDGTTAVYPPIQLKYTYARLQQAEQQRVASTNAALYPAAQAYCQQQNPTDFSGRNRVPCIEDYVSRYGAKEHVIPDSMYKFSFVSASWSPDLAGWSLVLSVILLVLTLLRIFVGYWSKRHL